MEPVDEVVESPESVRAIPGALGVPLRSLICKLAVRSLIRRRYSQRGPVGVDLALPSTTSSLQGEGKRLGVDDLLDI